MELMQKAIRHKAVIESARKDAKEMAERIRQKEEHLESIQREQATTEKAFDYLDALVKTESERFMHSFQTDIVKRSCLIWKS